LVGAVEVEYTIRIPEDSSVKADTATQNMKTADTSTITTAIQAKVKTAKGAEYSVAVTSNNAPVVTTEKTPVDSSGTTGTTGTDGVLEVASGAGMLRPAALLFLGAYKLLA